MRTKAQMDEVREELRELFYPGRVRFQGWATVVQRAEAPTGECQRRGCKSEATSRIRLNVWGTLVEAWVCAEHAEHDGESRDGWCCDQI